MAEQQAPTFPNGWGTIQLRHASSCLDGRRIPLNVEQRSRRQGEYPYWGANGIVDFIDEYLFDESLVLVGEDGAPFFDSTRPVAFFVTGKIWVNNHIHVLRIGRNLDPRFVTYCLNATDYGPHIEGSTRDKLTQEKMGSIRLPFPRLPHQHAIADYLDRETARIDALVATKERVLALLADKRRALITRAVTRGLAPNVPLRDSGIRWLGEIPAHWEVWKLGHSASVGNGSTPSRSNATYWTDGTSPWLNSSVVNRHEATEADQFVTETALRECHLPLVRTGSVLVAITGQGKTRGRAVVLSFDATINQHLAYVSPDLSRLDPWFLRWIFLSAYAFLRSISDDAGGTKGALTCEDVANLRLPVPPIDEQRAIVTHIANETGKLDDLRAVMERTTALLNERRTTLIGAAVKGQIGVESAA